MVFKRDIYPELLKHMNSNLVTVLTGMRRTGKTTLVKQLLEENKNKNSLYMDLQRPDIRELFSQKNYENIYDAFVAQGLDKNKKMIIALDEIQLLPDIVSVIKYLNDHKNIKFVVTGSSSYYLKNLFSESLSGRKKLFELYPLSFGEYLTFNQISFTKINWKEKPFDMTEFNRLSNYYDNYIKFGGFPQVVLASTDADKKDLLQDILSSYINIDVRTLSDFSDERNIYSLAKLLTQRIGSRIEYSTLANQLGISRVSVTNYITFLEKTYFIKLVPVFTKSKSREIVKSRKLYFCDTGLANTLSSLSSGTQFENTLFNQLSKLGTLQYYSLKNGKEIDFILDSKIALEAKETPTKNHLDTLLRISDTAGISEFRLIGKNNTPSFNNYIWAGSIK